MEKTITKKMRDDIESQVSYFRSFLEYHVMRGMDFSFLERQNCKQVIQEPGKGIVFHGGPPYGFFVIASTTKEAASDAMKIACPDWKGLNL